MNAARWLGGGLAALAVPVAVFSLAAPQVDDGRIPVIVEVSMAAISGDWPAAPPAGRGVGQGIAAGRGRGAPTRGDAGRGTIAPAAPFRPSSLIPDLQNAVPELPSFRKVGRALPLIRTAVQAAGGLRVTANSFFVCGTALKAQLPAIRTITNHPVFQNPPTSAGPRSVRGGGSRSAQEVAAAIDVGRLPSKGQGVLAAIVGDGFSLNFASRAYKSKCGTKGSWPCFEPRYSHSVISTVGPGSIGASDTHSAMVAYDLTIAAPDVTWADEVTAQSVCDAAQIYVDLAIDIIEQGLFGGAGATAPAYRGLVVVNSWAVADPTSDPDAADYVDDPRHPTSVMVGTLADLGADVVFAAGNCGPQPLAGCAPNAQRTIYGANSHPKVLTVGAVGLDQKAADYSSRGTGHLAKQKPDIGAYSDFVGSGKYGATDSGTSAAAPVAAGVLAALRSSVPFDPLNPSTFPAVLRDRLVQHAEPCQNRSGLPNYDVGWGTVSARCF